MNVKVVSARIPEDVYDFIEERVQNLTFGSFSHAVAYLLKLGMDVEKENERVVHRYKTGFNIDEPEQEKQEK